MKIDTNALILDLKGEPLRDGSAKEGEPVSDLTVGAVIVQTVLTPMKGDENLSGSDKVTYFKIAMRVSNADGEVEFTAAEVTKVLARIGKAWTPLVVGRVHEIFEEPETEE